MSRASKITLALTCTGALGIVFFVHYGQHAEKAIMHDGVLRDLDQQRRREELLREERAREEKARELRRLEFELQKNLEREYKKLQSVTDTTHLAPPSTEPTKK